ncbi:hypothetical protein D3C72_1398900 [compost metagenome]
MHDLGRATFQFGLEQRQDVEGDGTGRCAPALIDDGDDAISQAFGVAAQHAVAQGGLIQRRGGHCPQVSRQGLDLRPRQGQAGALDDVRRQIRTRAPMKIDHATVIRGTARARPPALLEGSPAPRQGERA